MDIYTTSFCLPRNPLSHVLSPANSFDFGTRDGSAVNGTNGSSQLPTQSSPRDSTSSFSTSTAPSATSSMTAGGSNPTNRNSSSSLATDVSGMTGSTGVGTSLGSRGSLDLNDAMHKLCVDAMAAHQCLVSFSQLESPSTPSVTTQGGTQQAGSSAPFEGQAQQAQGGAVGTSPQGRLFNFHLSGGYQQVMSARGSILRDNPFKVSPFPFLFLAPSSARMADRGLS